jgi:DNA-directed RNA polymerase specialized sigma24 family protein
MKGWLIFLPDEELLSKESGIENPEVKAIRSEQEEWLSIELDRLKKTEKDIILLKDIDKLKFDEISSFLNLKLPTVKSIYRRSKLKLTKLWEARYA